jgi:hypothetical protein
MIEFSRGESVSINDLISGTITTLGEMSIRVVGKYLQLPLKESEIESKWRG